MLMLLVALLVALWLGWAFWRPFWGGAGRAFRFRARGKFYFGAGDVLFASWRNALPDMRGTREQRAVEAVRACWHAPSSSSSSSSSFSSSALVTLSVRTAFDLFLRSLRLPPGSEIIFSSVNIKDMLLIAKHHGLVVVPLDVDLKTMEPRMDLLDGLVSSRTKILLVAHIFGARFDMKPWVLAARRHGLLLVEDCAESFEGPKAYSGDPESDISLFSFGAIKTCSALGGGVSFVRDASILDEMRSLHAAYPARSRLQFAKRLVSYAVLCALQHPLVLGAALRLLEMCGGDFETLLTNAVRGFAGSELVTAIRHRPPVAMVELLARKLAEFDSDAVIGVRSRLGRIAVAELGNAVVVPGAHSAKHGFWLFPVLARNAGALIAALRRSGVDATQGATQLACVPPARTAAGVLAASEAARTMWRHVVYLPVYPGMDEAEVRAMARVVREHCQPPILESPGWESREELMGKLSRTEFDVLVVGGGINGAAAARDAAMRGLRVALVEREDYAAAASGNSAKLIHGGFRYVERLQLGLVSELCQERDLQRRLNPHLVRLAQFLLPMRRGYGNRMAKIGVGLWLYDLCARFANGIHRRLGVRSALIEEPLLSAVPDLMGAFLYSDCVADDTRLTLANVRAARANGAVVLNHCSLVSRGKDDVTFVCRDEVSKSVVPVRARHLVIATGSELDVLAGTSPSCRLLDPAKGIHIAIARSELPVRSCVGFQSGADRRWCFCVPFGPVVVVGTTETRPVGSERDFRATRGEVRYLLDAANSAFGLKLGEENVRSSWSGLRPLLRADEAETLAKQQGLVERARLFFFHAVSQSSSGSGSSREDKVISQGSNTTLIAGGKLTPYRRVAQRVVDLLSPKVPCLTRDVPLDERAGPPPAVFSDSYAAHLYWSYGSEADWIERRQLQHTEETRELCPGILPHRLAEVSLAVIGEQACTLCDVLVRRVPLALLAPDNGRMVAPDVADHMAKLLNRDQSWAREQVASYMLVVDRMHQWKRDPPNDPIAPNIKL